jgi:hypothetical protein
MLLDPRVLHNHHCVAETIHAEVESRASEMYIYKEKELRHKYIFIYVV